MFDRYDREINYLRISVTDRCNLRCTYCSPDDCDVPSLNGQLTIKKIVTIVESGVELGLTKVRLTGGEPLVRRDIVEMVAAINSIRGVEQLAMTTNGILLPRLANRLKLAGLDRANISLDSVDANRYRNITRNGSLQSAIKGIDAAKEVGIPVKINMVVLSDTEEREIADVRKFCEGRGLELQLIRQYSLKSTKLDDADYDRPPPCGECNRIRLLSDGTLKPCLHSDIEIELDPSNPKESLIAAINAKPARGVICSRRGMAEIGG